MILTYRAEIEWVNVSKIEKVCVLRIWIVITIVTGGSNNLSPGTSTQLISMAPSSPGEQGTSKSSHMISLFVGEGPVTR